MYTPLLQILILFFQHHPKIPPRTPAPLPPTLSHKSLIQKAKEPEGFVAIIAYI